MTAPVVWLKGRNLCWDQEQVSGWLDHDGLTHHERIPDDTDGCVLVVPARYYQPADIQTLIDPLAWVVVILTSDEESTFDHGALTHPNMVLWVMTPRPDRHEPGPRHLTEGCPADTNDLLAPNLDVARRRPLDVFFAGQITHDHRRQFADAMSELSPDWHTEIMPTDGFLQGLDRADYLAVMAATQIAPCPSGPATPDSFRLVEALEAVALPIADGTCPAYDTPGYWDLVFDGAPPFPVIDKWDDLSKYVAEARRGYPLNATTAAAWWIRHKRTQRNRLHDDITRLAATPLPDGCPVTVLVPTSPIPSHPSIDTIAATIASVRDQLPDAEIIVMADGVRTEQNNRRKDYELYRRDLVWHCSNVWDNVVPLIFPDHQHQANITRAALELVRTPLVLFVEHDTPLCGHIPWDDLYPTVLDGMADVIRFHHEAHVLEPHMHLMPDGTDRTVIDGVPLLRTCQWSQRPHLASVGFYRTIIDTYFGRASRTMIEDVMHGVVHQAWERHGEAGWQQFRLWMYAPEGDMKRSLHLDGRGGDPKYSMTVAYDGDTPEGAPQPCVWD